MDNIIIRTGNRTLYNTMQKIHTTLVHLGAVKFFNFLHCMYDFMISQLNCA